MREESVPYLRSNTRSSGPTATATEWPCGWAATSAGANSAAPLTSASSTAVSSMDAADSAVSWVGIEGLGFRGRHSLGAQRGQCREFGSRAASCNSARPVGRCFVELGPFSA
jgi:hypothetical protein